MDGEEKRKTYARYKSDLKKALQYEFWFEATFLEYAIIEDRTESLIRHAGDIKLTNKRGQPLKLSEKLNRIESCKAFTEKKIRRYLTLDLIERIRNWKRTRDRMTHDLMKQLPDDETLESIAKEGNEIVKILDSKTKSVNSIFYKRKEPV